MSGQAGLEACRACRVLTGACLQDLSEDEVVDVGAL